MARIGVQILGDSSSLERAFKRSEVAAAEFNGRMNKLGQATRGALSTTGGKGSFLFGSGSFIAAATATAAITKTVSAASDLNEQITKSQAVFGQSAQSIRDWSKTTAQSFGISQAAALEATGTFGNLFRTVDLAPQQAAEMSRALTELAADLASFNNANINDVLLAIRSGLIGEAEPLRRFGVLLSETRVQQEALAETGKKSVKALTDQEKALARYKIILQDTVPAQGDFQRTSSGLANQLRILKANLSDLAASMGKTFLPAVNESVKGLNLFFGGLHQQDLLAQLTANISASADEMTNALPALEAYREQLAAIKGESDLLVVALGNVADQIRAQQEAARFAKSDASRGEGNTAQSVVGINAALQAESERKAVAEAKASRKRLQKQFDVLSKGLGLKLDKAALSGSLDAQLKVLGEMERAILRQEKRVGKTFDLEDKLTQVRQQIKDLQEQKTSEALARQQDKEQKILALKEKQAEAVRKQIAEQKRLAAEAQRALDAATSQARSLFGTLFQVPEQAQRTLTILGGSKGRQTVTLPGAGGGEDARGLLTDLTSQIKSFKQLQQSIATLQAKGAPKSLLEAARSGQISADQVNALAKANAQTLNQIFKNVRVADKLISRAARAEINAKDVTIKATTVKVGAAINATTDHGPGGPSGFVINGGLHIHGVQNVKQLENELERRRKKRTQQTRGRTGGKR